MLLNHPWEGQTQHPGCGHWSRGTECFMLLRFRENSLDNWLSTVLLHTLSPDNSLLKGMKRSLCSHGWELTLLEEFCARLLAAPAAAVAVSRTVWHQHCNQPWGTAWPSSHEECPGTRARRCYPIHWCAFLPTLGLLHTPEGLWQEALSSLQATQEIHGEYREEVSLLGIFGFHTCIIVIPSVEENSWFLTTSCRVAAKPSRQQREHISPFSSAMG